MRAGRMKRPLVVAFLGYTLTLSRLSFPSFPQCSLLLLDEVETGTKQRWTRSQKRKLKRRRTKQKAQHRAFPRGPPPQYYPGSNLLNFAVRMGSGEPG